jgi:hypothetical protein
MEHCRIESSLVQVQGNPVLLIRKEPEVPISLRYCIGENAAAKLRNLLSLSSLTGINDNAQNYFSVTGRDGRGVSMNARGIHHERRGKGVCTLCDVFSLLPHATQSTPIMRMAGGSFTCLLIHSEKVTSRFVLCRTVKPH